MGTNVNWNGTIYTQPTQGDAPPWGTKQADLVVAIAQNALSKAGGTFSLTNALSFGNNFGISALSVSSTASNPAQSGFLRMANGEGVVWRDSTNTIDLALTVDTNGVLLFDGVPITASNPNSSIYVYVNNYVDTTRGFGIYSGATVTAGSPLITLFLNANGQRFTPDMVGMKVYASGFSNSGGYPTVATYISPTQITLSANATSSQTLGAVRLFEYTQNDTVGIRNAIAAAQAINGKIVFGTRTYVYDSSIELAGIMGSQGQGVNSTFFVPFTPLTQTGDCFYELNLPVGFEFSGHNICGPNDSVRTAAYLSSMTIANGVLTAVVDNGVTVTNGQNIRIVGPRNTGTPLRWTYYTVTSSSPTSIVANAITWNGRPGVTSVSTISISASVLTITTSSAHQMQSAERPYMNTISGGASFLSGQRLTLTSGTISGTSTITAASPAFTSTTATPSGANTIYGGTFVAGSMVGLTVAITGFTNAANNGTFVVSANDAVSITVNNGTGVVATGNSGSITVTTYASAANTGTVAYLRDAVYTDFGAAHMDYVGVRLGRNPVQAATILNKINIHDNVVQNFLGDAWTLFQPNYGTFWNNSGTTAGSCGLSLMSANPTTGRFTNPSAFHIGASNQLYGAMAGLAIVSAAGLSVTGAGNNVSGSGILLDQASGVSITGFDLETQTPYTGMTDLFPGYCIELRGGSGNSFNGGFSLVGNPSNTAAQTLFKVWGNALAFEYANVRHVGSAGYTQPTLEIDIANDSSNYNVRNVALIGSAANVSALGTGTITIAQTLTQRANASTVGIEVLRSQDATNSINYQSPAVMLSGKSWTGAASIDDTYSINTIPKTGSNPVSRLTFSHTSGGGASGYDFTGTGGGLPYFSVTGGGIELHTNTAATALANPPAPKVELVTKIWDGATSIDDTWTLQSIPATPGANPLVTLKMSHTGSTGLGRVQIESTGLTVTSNQATTSATTGALVVVGGIVTQSDLSVYGNVAGIANALPGTIVGDTFVANKPTPSFTFNTYFDTVGAVWKSTRALAYGYLIRSNNLGQLEFMTQGQSVAEGDTMTNTTRMTLDTANVASVSRTTGTLTVAGGLGVSGQVSSYTQALGTPVTVSAGTKTIAITEYSLIFTTTNCTVTMPDPTVYVGRTLLFKTTAAFTVISAASNVVPLIGGAAGTAILAATAGKFAYLQSDGTNWIIMMAN